MAWLTYQSSWGKREIPLDRAALFIGRDEQCRICIKDEPMASRRHAEIRRRPDGGYEVRDLGSKNGTYLNGEKIEKPAPLKNGDVIRVGETAFAFSTE